MTDQPKEKSADYNRTSMLDVLFKKLAYVRSLGGGGDDSAAAKEVLRQIAQASRKNGGNPISGEGVTKSTNNEEDL